MNKLISDTRKLAKKYGIKIRLINKKHIIANGELTPTNGYFCPTDKILAVATRKPQSEWLPIFIHESCHLDQSIHDLYQWEKWNVGYTMFFEWLDGKTELDKKTLIKCCQDIIECELDCEKRTVEKMKLYDVDINRTWYTRMANLYLYSYVYLMQVRRWKKGLYMNEHLTVSAPAQFQKSYLKIPPELKSKLKEFYKD